MTRQWTLILTVILLLILHSCALAQGTRQGQAFALGLTLQMPTARAEAFLQSVRSLRDTTADDTPGDIGNLAKDAQALRYSESLGYENAARLLNAMGAPERIYAWANGVSHLLSDPQIVSKEAKPYEKSDPSTASVLSTIDEAEAVKVIADRNLETVQTWLKVTQGSSGMWAVTLGRLTGGMQVASQTDQPFLLPRETVLMLHDTAPAQTPPIVLKTLASLAPRGKGNLGYLVHLPDVTIPAAKAGPPAEALLAAYGAEALAQK